MSSLFHLCHIFFFNFGWTDKYPDERTYMYIEYFFCIKIPNETLKLPNNTDRMNRWIEFTILFSVSNKCSLVCPERRTDVQLKWNKGPFLWLIEDYWPLILMLRNELYCSLLFCLQLDGPLSHFGSADGQMANGKSKLRGKSEMV